MGWPTVGQPTDQTLQDELVNGSGGKLSDCDEGEETNERVLELPLPSMLRMEPPEEFLNIKSSK